MTPAAVPELSRHSSLAAGLILQPDPGLNDREQSPLPGEENSSM